MANNKMLIDTAHPEETRVVMVRGNRVDEFDFESEHKTQLRGNIYLAKVTRVEPSLQAAFVDYGGNRHGFLAFSEIHPDYYQIPVADRQALLDAEAEDARAAAAAEVEEDNDDASDADANEAEDKPARKRRSRRRGGKKVEAADETTSDSEEEASAASATDAASEVTPETSNDADITTDTANDEESDDNDTVMSAENDDDNVVSESAAEEPAKKPRRRTSRKKVVEEPTEQPVVETADAAVADNPAAEVSSSEDEAPKKKPRRRTSRKKVESVEADTSDAPETTPDAVAETPSDEGDAEAKENAPRKTRRRTSRKKAVPEQAVEAVVETETATTAPTSATSPESADEVVASGEETATPQEDTEAKEGNGRKPRSRSRSRRRKKSDVVDKTSDDADDDGETSVESMGSDDGLEEVLVRRAPRRHYKIQEVIKRRQILLVQVVKEERGNKGAALTTYLSLAGRYSVLMPNTARGGGISRKITNTSDRKRLKAIASDLAVPQGMGVILRTAGASRQPDDIQRDFEYLMRLWENVRTLTLESSAPCLVYEEGNLIKRSIRDLYDKDTGEILVAGEEGYKEAKDFMTMLMPNHTKNVKLYRDKIPMFARMGVEAQLDAMLQPQVTLKSGGYLILDQTEALVAIDVNSGRSTRQHSIEETAVQTNLEAADEVARQLRLRDLAGLIVIDFIDMEDKRNIRAVEKRLKDALKNDRARIQVGRISHFGLMEMSRQRIRASVLESTTQVCPTCEGLGHVRAASSIVLAVLRAIEEQLNRNSRNNLIVKVSTPTALYLLNNKRDNLGDLESRFGVSISIATDETIGTIPCVIERGEQSNRKPAVESAVQPDTINPQDDEITAQVAASSDDAEQDSSTNEQTDDANTENGEGDGKKKRRRRRRKRGGNNEETVTDTADSGDSNDTENSAAPEVEATETDAAEDKPTNSRVRRKRRSKPADSDTGETEATDTASESIDDGEPSKADVSEETVAAPETAPEKPKRRRTKKVMAEAEPAVEATEETSVVEEESTPKRRTTRRKTKVAAEEPAPDATADVAEVAAANESAVTSEPAQAEEIDEKKPTKSGWWQRKFF